MKVVKVTPRGYCLGVVKLIKWAKEADVKYAGRQIYMLGYLVHNKHVIDEIVETTHILYFCGIYIFR